MALPLHRSHNLTNLLAAAGRSSGKLSSLICNAIKYAWCAASRLIPRPSSLTNLTNSVFRMPPISHIGSDKYSPTLKKSEKTYSQVFHHYPAFLPTWLQGASCRRIVAVKTRFQTLSGMRAVCVKLTSRFIEKCEFLSKNAVFSGFCWCFKMVRDIGFEPMTPSVSSFRTCHKHWQIDRGSTVSRPVAVVYFENLTHLVGFRS